MSREKQTQHYAANGRRSTACGVLAGPASSNRLDPRCERCRRVLKRAAKLDVDALVATSEDDRNGADLIAATAVINAQALALQLGAGWRPRVWENLGWHFSAVHRYGHVSPSGGAGYTAFFNPSGKGPGGLFTSTGRTPRSAVERMLQMAREVINEYAHAVAQLKGRR